MMGGREERVLLAGLAVRELRRTRSAGGHGRFLLSLGLPCGEEDDGLGELALGGFRFLVGGFSWAGVARGERPRGDLEDTAEGVCSGVLALRVRGVRTVTSSSEESSVSAREAFCSLVSKPSAASGLHFLCRDVLVTWGLGDLSGELSNVGLELTVITGRDLGGRPRFRFGGDTGSSTPLLLVPSAAGMLEDTLGMTESAEGSDDSPGVRPETNVSTWSL